MIRNDCKTLLPVSDTYIDNGFTNSENEYKSFETEEILRLKAEQGINSDLRKRDIYISFIRFDTKTWTNEDIKEATCIKFRFTTTPDVDEVYENGTDIFEILSLEAPYKTNWDNTLTWVQASEKGLANNMNGDTVRGGLVDSLKRNTTYELDVTDHIKYSRLNKKDEIVVFKLLKSRQNLYSFYNSNNSFSIYSSRATVDENKPKLVLYKESDKKSCSVELDTSFLKDPNKIIDESFFGKWNGKMWVVEPILRYDDFPEMKPVSESVKLGNIKKAKEELLIYFKKRSVPQHFPINKGFSFPVKNGFLREKTCRDTEKITYQSKLAKEEIYTKFVSEVVEFSVGNEWRWSKVIIPTLDNGSIILMDPEKNGSELIFHSKDGIKDIDKVNSKDNLTYAPYFEIETNEKSYKIYPQADTYIQAGINSSKVNGRDQFLRVREDGIPLSDNTKRSYLYFNTSILDLSLGIKSITLNIYGKNESGTGEHRCFIIQGNAAIPNFDEDTFKWDDHLPLVFSYKNPTTNKYGNYNWTYPPNAEIEWINHNARFQQVVSLTNTYLESGDELWANIALTQVMSFYNVRQARAPRDLDNQWRLPSITYCCFGLLDSNYMTPEVLTAYLKLFYEHSLIVENAPLYYNNHGSVKTMGQLMIACYLPEILPNTAKNNGDYFQNLKNELISLYNALVMPDGAYVEAVTSGYACGVLNDMMNASEHIVATKLEGLPTEIKNKIVGLGKYLMNLSFPNGITIPYGDFAFGSIVGTVERAGVFTKDPQLIWFATKGQQGMQTDNPSVCYKDNGLVVMKTSAIESDGIALYSNADNGRMHAHYDDLNIDMYAYGRVVLREPGYAEYTTGSELDLIPRRTDRHNTVAIDGKNQSAVHGRGVPAGINVWITNSSFDYVEEYTSATKPFIHTRKILFLKSQRYAIVSDFIDVKGDTLPHFYTQTWNPDINAKASLEEGTKKFQTHYINGGNIQVVPADPENIIAEIRTDTFVDAIKNDNNGYVFYRKVDAVGNQNFDTVLYPIKQGDDVTDIKVSRIKLSVSSTVASAIEISLKNNEKGSYYVAHDKSGVNVSFGAYSTDAEIAYLQKNDNGDFLNFVVINGKNIKDTSKGIDMVSAALPIKDLSVIYDGNTLYIWNEESFNQNSISIFAPQTITRLNVNGSDKLIKRKGDYITLTIEF